MSVIDTASGAGAPVPPEPEHYCDLGAVQREAFSIIGRCVADRRHAFHTPVLVTHGIDGFRAARTVVLRGFDATERVLVFHSDRRSRKVAELAAGPRIAPVFYEPKNKIQVRVDGWASVHVADGVTAGAWKRLALFSRRSYLPCRPGRQARRHPPLAQTLNLSHRR